MLAPSFQFQIEGSKTETATPPAVVAQETPAQPVTTGQLSNPKARSTTSTLSLRTVLWLSWATVAILLLGSLSISLFRLRRLRRSAIPSLETQALLDRSLAGSGINRPVEVLLHILPGDASSWSDNDLHRVFVHELEHIKRGDWFVQVLTRGVCAIYWFQPLIWIAWRQICLEAERSCDDAVVVRTERTDYAEQLVVLARRLSNTLTLPVLSMANRSDLSRRVHSILDNSQARGRAGLRWTTLALTSSLAIVFAFSPGLAISRTQTQTTKTDRVDVKVRAIDRALVEAAESGELKEVEELLNAGANVNGISDGDGTALIVAAREGNKTLVEFLLARGADVNLASPGDGNPLIMAAREGHVEIVKILLERGARIDDVVEGDENPLIQASASGELEVVKLLISRGANVNAGRCPIGQMVSGARHSGWHARTGTRPSLKCCSPPERKNRNYRICPNR
jgi:hypothetical protein